MSQKKNNLFDATTGVVYPRFRSAYNHDCGRSYHTVVEGESMTKQEFKDQCDVNNIVDHFTRTGRLDAFRQAQGMYLDMTDLPGSYHESLNHVIAAREAFDALPATARARFNNDVQAFLDAAASDPEAVFGPRDENGMVVAQPTPEAPPASSNPDPEPTTVS